MALGTEPPDPAVGVGRNFAGLVEPVQRRVPFGGDGREDRGQALLEDSLHAIAVGAAGAAGGAHVGRCLPFVAVLAPPPDLIIYRGQDIGWS